MESKKLLTLFKLEYFQKGSRHMGNGNGLPNILARVAKISDRKQLKILTPIQMVQRLPIALTQVKAGNTYESLLNEIRHTFFVCSKVNYFKSDG